MGLAASGRVNERTCVGNIGESEKCRQQTQARDRSLFAGRADWGNLLLAAQLQSRS